MINNCYIEGELTPSQRLGTVTLLCKGVDKADLLNVDYKIVSKSLANRLKLVLSSIIHHDQTCSIPGRSIHDN